MLPFEPCCRPNAVLQQPALIPTDSDESPPAMCCAALRSFQRCAEFPAELLVPQLGPLHAPPQHVVAKVAACAGLVHAWGRTGGRRRGWGRGWGRRDGQGQERGVQVRGVGSGRGRSTLAVSHVRCCYKRASRSGGRYNPAGQVLGVGCGPPTANGGTRTPLVGVHRQHPGTHTQ